jgi:D-sedoheptulose 7-phosphate isomerase
MENIIKIIEESIIVKKTIINNQVIIENLNKAVEKITLSFNNGNKLLFCGNGGSAADAQHLAAEFSGRFYIDRVALPAEALHCNTSYVTAVGNDYGYEFIYSRIVEGIAKKGDVLIGLSTSGNSLNIINAMKIAREKGVLVIALTGTTGGKMKEFADILLNVPSNDTPRIQESHILLGHIICELVEKNIFSK